jgi:hypothetical protein
MKEARKRSVDNLQRLYTVVVTLAVTESLRRLLGDYAASGQVGDLPSYQGWLMFISLIVTVVPFYHGANRYLDATFVTGERTAKRAALMVDFITLFVQGMLLFGLATVIINRDLFYTLLAMLLVLDIIWIGLTHLTSASANRDESPSYAVWATINLPAAILILVFVWSNIFVELWSSDIAKNIALVAVATVRTVFDYSKAWDFYFPKP